MVKKNYNYGKIVDGKLEYAPNRIRVTMLTPTGTEVEVSVFNATAEQYLSVGYKAIVQDDYPQDGKTYEMDFVVTDDTIYIHWREIEPPVPTPTIDEQVEANSAAIIDIAAELWG